MIELEQVYADNFIDGRTIKVVDLTTRQGYAQCEVLTGKRPGSFIWIRASWLGTAEHGYTPITNKENQ